MFYRLYKSITRYKLSLTPNASKEGVLGVMQRHHDVATAPS